MSSRGPKTEKRKFEPGIFRVNKEESRVLDPATSYRLRALDKIRTLVMTGKEHFEIPVLTAH